MSLVPHRFGTYAYPELATRTGAPAGNALERSDTTLAMDLTSILWIGIGLGAGVFAINVLWQRYVKKTPRAMESGGSFLMFGLLMLAFALFSIGIGVFTSV